MSAASRIILFLVLASLGAAASLLPWGTDKETTATLALRQQDVAVPTAASAVQPMQGPPTEPSAILPEPTTLITDRHPVRRPITLNQPAKPRGREAVARELQRELRRVGCYAGQLHGVWTASTRWAMRAFNDRVNAVLPTNAILSLPVGITGIVRLPDGTNVTLSSTDEIVLPSYPDQGVTYRTTAFLQRPDDVDVTLTTI